MKKLLRLAALPLILALLLSALSISVFAEEQKLTPEETVRQVYELIADYSLRYNGESLEALMLSAAEAYFKREKKNRDLLCVTLGYTDFAALLADAREDAGIQARFGEALMDRFTAEPKVMEAFLDTMLQQQDRHAHFMFPDDYESSYQLSDDYVGIGVTLTSEDPYCGLIESVFAGSPAERAGLRAGDIIIGVNGEDMEGQHYSELAARIRGEEGTAVTLRVRRAGETLDFTITRERITVSDISFENYDGIAFIRVSHFNNLQTFADFFSALVRAKDEGCTAILYDLRDNLGGNVEVLYNMLHHAVFNDGAEVFSLVDRSGEPVKYTSNGVGWRPNAIAVLINGNTASASEMFAGALKYSAGATLVGSTSFGKGVGQYHVPLEDGSMVIITNFEILLPGGRRYNEAGITPDLSVALETVEFPAYDTLAALGSSSLTLGSSSTNVLGLEERLHLLGFFGGTPDNLFDDDTLAAVNEFQEYAELPVRTSADAGMLKALDQYFLEYAARKIIFDRQLETALDLLRPAANMPLGVTGAVAE